MSQDVQRLGWSIEQDVPSQSVRPRRTAFGDLLRVGLADVRYAYDGAYRLPESLSLAQRSEFGLCERAGFRPPFATVPSIDMGTTGALLAGALFPRAADVEGSTPHGHAKVPAARRGPYNVQTTLPYPPADAPRHIAAKHARNRAGCAWKSTTDQRYPYSCFTASVGELAIRCIVFRGRSFVGAAPWTR